MAGTQGRGFRRRPDHRRPGCSPAPQSRQDCADRRCRDRRASRALCAAGGADADGAAARRRGHHHLGGRRRHGMDRDDISISRARNPALAAAAAAGDPDLYRRLYLCRHPRHRRPGAGSAARDLRLAFAPGLLVSAYPLARRRHLHHRLRALSLYLPRRARDVSNSAPRFRRCRAHARCAALCRGAADHHTAGAAGARGRHRADLAGDAERYRRERISRRADADAFGFHHLAQPRQPAGRGADLADHACRRSGADRARALRPPAPGLCHAGARPGTGAAHPAARPRRTLGGDPLLHSGRARLLHSRDLPAAPGDHARAA